VSIWHEILDEIYYQHEENFLERRNQMITERCGISAQTTQAGRVKNGIRMQSLTPKLSSRHGTNIPVYITNCQSVLEQHLLPEALFSGIRSV
jgi:hypothetical protein